jgi:hypothetical protein
MIEKYIHQQSGEYIGGFIANYADPVMNHINPGTIFQNSIVVAIKRDKTIWAARESQFATGQILNSVGWQEITKDNIKKRKSPILRKICYFQINRGSLYGIYIITEDLISNEHFSNEKSYLDFMVE